MAKDYNQVLLDKGYSQEQINAMKDAVASGRSASDVVKEMNSSMGNTKSPAATQNQASGGKYVYDPVSEYYVLEGSTNNQATQTTPTVKQETKVEQTQNQGTTEPEIKQEGALTPLSQEYYNQANDDALNTIRDNLNRYKQSNPEYFTDYESFKRNFSYNARNEEQKNLLDNWYKGYQDGLTLASTPTSDLYTQYKNGNLSSAQIENLRTANPTKYAELQAQINKGNVVEAYDDDKDMNDMFNQLRNTYLENMIANLTNAGSEGSAIFSKYEENMNSPEMMEIQDKTTELQEQIENIQDDIATMTKAVEKEYEGTGATRSKINAIVADRTYDLQLQLRTLNSEYNKYATQYNNRMQQYQTEFTMELQEYQLNMKERNQKMNELGFAMDLMSFETPDQIQEREWNYRVKQQEYVNGDINSKDPTARYKAALKSVQNLLSQYDGIPMKRSAEEMAQDIITAIDNGSNLGAELSKINQQIQQKPEYRYLYNQTFKPASGFGNSVSIGGVDYIEYNGKLYTSDEFNKQFGGQAKAYNSISSGQLGSGYKAFFKNFDEKYKNGIGGQCGKFVNDYLQTIGVGRYYDNDLKTKLQSVNSQTPTIGSIAVFDYNHKSSDGVNYGHVAIVTDILPDGRIQVMDSNYGSDGTIKERLIEPNSPSLKGFFDPTIPYGGAGGNSTLGLTSGTTTQDYGVDTSITAGGLSNSQLTQLAKDYIDGERTYSDIDKTHGSDVLHAVGTLALQLREGGYNKSTKITDPNRLFNAEQSLKKDYDSLIEGPQGIIDFVNQMETAYELLDTAPSAAGQAIIYAYNKILDSRSIVREGEYDRAAGGQSVIDEFIGKVEKYINGGPGVTKDELGRYLQVARSLGEVAESKKMDIANRAKTSIDTYGFNPESILGLDMYNKLYGGGLESEDYWSEFRSNTPKGVVNIDLGGGLSIQRP